ncbi:MAG: hypothetical protein HN882_08225 [Planctomycetaceae bacterium]|nr:hypothetical protein [Planctomycetaceae bacterium]
MEPALNISGGGFWWRGGFAALVIVLCVNVIQADSPDTGLADAMSKAQRRGLPIFVYVYDSI